jgi:hypothetical protein
MRLRERHGHSEFLGLGRGGGEHAGSGVDRSDLISKLCHQQG